MEATEMGILYSFLTRRYCIESWRVRYRETLLYGKLEDLDDLMDLELLDDPVLLERVKVQEDLELLNQQLGLLSLERQQDSQPVNQHSEHEPESASRVKRDLSEVEFESTMKRKRFM